MKKVWIVGLVVCLLIALAGISGAAAASVVYTLPAKVLFPTYDECEYYSGWTTEYISSYEYAFQDRKNNEPERFYIMKNDGCINLDYPNPENGPYGSEAGFSAYTANGKDYLQLSIARGYYDINEQIEFAIIQNNYSSSGELVSVNIYMKMALSDGEWKLYNVSGTGNNYDEWEQHQGNGVWKELENPSRELLKVFEAVKALVNTDSITVKYSGTFDARSYLKKIEGNLDPVMTFTVPESVELPSRIECEKYKNWLYTNIGEDGYASYYLEPSDSPYSVRVEFNTSGQKNAYLRQNISGTNIDPLSGASSMICFWYLDGSNAVVWLETNKQAVSGVFDHLYIWMHYSPRYTRAGSGEATFRIGSQETKVEFFSGEWQITDEVKSALGSGETLQKRLSYLTNYTVKPIKVEKSGTLSIYDYISKLNELYLPDSLKTIESQAFVGTKADVIYIPESVTSIAKDAFESDVLLVLPNSKLESWAKTNHPNYQISP